MVRCNAQKELTAIVVLEFGIRLWRLQGRRLQQERRTQATCQGGFETSYSCSGCRRQREDHRGAGHHLPLERRRTLPPALNTFPLPPLKHFFPCHSVQPSSHLPRGTLMLSFLLLRVAAYPLLRRSARRWDSLVPSSTVSPATVRFRFNSVLLSSLVSFHFTNRSRRSCDRSQGRRRGRFSARVHVVEVHFTGHAWR